MGDHEQEDWDKRHDYPEMSHKHRSYYRKTPGSIEPPKIVSTGSYRNTPRDPLFAVRFRLDSRRKPLNIHHEPFVRSFPDLFKLVPGFHAAVNPAFVDGNHLGAEPDVHADVSGREVPEVDLSSDRILPWGKILPDEVAAGHFQESDQVRRREHPGGLQIEKTDRYFACNQQILFALRADWDVHAAMISGGCRLAPALPVSVTLHTGIRISPCVRVGRIFVI
jgi:hypothetical protein